MTKHCNAKSKLKMLRTVLLPLFALACFVLGPSLAQAKYSALIMEDATGKILHSRNIDTKRHPASLTKIMTLYMTFDALRAGRISLDTELVVSRRATRAEPSKLALRRGDKIKVRDAIMALITKSANDVAIVVAEGLAGSEAAFAKRMTSTARSIGMSRTTFRNASGLYNKAQKSTARDMATLARRMISDFPEYYTLFKTKSFTYRGTKYKNHNNLLGRYSGTDGIKTGYIGAAGFNLVASVTRHGVRLIGVVFGGRSSRSRDRQMMALLDDAFLGYEAIAIRAPRKPGMPLVGGTLVAKASPQNPFLKKVNSALSISANAAEAPKAPILARAQEPAPQEILGEWSIQVGAFRSDGRARKAAGDAKNRLGGMVAPSVVAVVPTRGKKPLYRARITGLQKSMAFAACSKLKQKRRDCLVLSPRNSTQIANR